MQVQNSDPSKMKLDEANHWALKAFLKLYHKQSGSVDFEGWRIVIEGNMPASAQIQKHALRNVAEQLVLDTFRDFGRDKKGCIINVKEAKHLLKRRMTDLTPEDLIRWRKWFESRVPGILSKPVIFPASQYTPVPEASKPRQQSKNINPSKTSKIPSSNDDPELDAWVYLQYCERGFIGSTSHFIGYPSLTNKMITLRPKKRNQIEAAVKRLKKPGSQYSFRISQDIKPIKTKTSGEKKRNVTAFVSDNEEELPTPSQGGLVIENGGEKKRNVIAFVSGDEEGLPTPSQGGFVIENGEEKKSNATVFISDDEEGLSTPSQGGFVIENGGAKLASRFKAVKPPVVTEGLDQLNLSDGSKPSQSLFRKSTCDYAPPAYDLMDQLMPEDVSNDEGEEKIRDINMEIQHAPLIAAGLLTTEHFESLPQYGFLGIHDKSKMFLNTNVPFSVFICGVQGSGKSHTTSCILENALIPSQHLGRLEQPLSALVFSYSSFSGEGSGFNVSEAAFLAAPNPSIPHHPQVKKVNVLVSPSNPKIAKLYRKIPNVTVVPYKLKPSNLDIDTMLVLMAVNESDTTPLYLAEVIKILRDMATKNTGSFNYTEFKKQLNRCNFNASQQNMLQLRLDLLESFLDLKNQIPEPKYQPGEITIMDMSCPFVDANTACILFKIGMQQYLRSNTPGKMVVLDEAHKYMLKVPGARELNEQLLTTIRLQRHYGTRVIISTQEPTLLTSLIALCSVTIIHRFSSPEWFAAIKRHIPIDSQEQDKLLRDIESLKTGTALLYSSNAVLKKNEDGSLVKGTGRLMKIHIRKRVTRDGGQSVLAS